jgi:hypothetical protein
MNTSVPCVWRHTFDRGNFTFLQGGARATFLYILLGIISDVFSTDWLSRGGIFCNTFPSVPVFFCWLRHFATSRKVAGSIPDGVTGIFHSPWSFRPHCVTGVESASVGNEYQEYLFGGKDGRCVQLIYHLNVPIVMKSRSLNLLELSRPVQACTGIALPLPLSVFFCYIFRSSCVCVVCIICDWIKQRGDVRQIG